MPANRRPIADLAYLSLVDGQGCEAPANNLIQRQDPESPLSLLQRLSVVQRTRPDMWPAQCPQVITDPESGAEIPSQRSNVSAR
jgi:hypothetical protein